MPRSPLALLVGADAFHGLPAWHRWKHLFDLAHIVVVPRPGIELAAVCRTRSQRSGRRGTSTIPRLLRARTGRLHLRPAGHRAADLVDRPYGRHWPAANVRPVEIAGLLPAAFWPILNRNDSTPDTHPHAF